MAETLYKFKASLADYVDDEQAGRNEIDSFVTNVGAVLERDIHSNAKRERLTLESITKIVAEFINQEIRPNRSVTAGSIKNHWKRGASVRKAITTVLPEMRRDLLLAERKRALALSRKRET